MSPSRFRAAIWDMDGTLIDSEELHFQSWHAVMATCGIHYSREEFLAGFGKTTETVFREYLGPDIDGDHLQQLIRHKADMFRETMPGVLQLLPGAAQWLADFAGAGMYQVVASSAPMASIAAVLQELQIGDYFTAILSGVRLPRSKPDPALFWQAASAVRMSPDTCVVLEDSSFGIEAARRAGMASLAVGPHAHGLDTTLAAELGHIPCRVVPDLSAARWDDIRATLVPPPD